MKFQALKALAICIFLASLAVAAEQDAEGWIDLLNAVEPQKQAAAGRWRITEAGLAVEAMEGARLALPWKPSAEYDFEVAFTRETGSNSIALIFVAGGQQASLDIDGWGQNLAGIQNIAGRTIKDNPTRVANQALTNGKRYTATVRVRKDRVETLLNGKPLATYRGDGSDLSLLDLWRLPEGSAIGVGAWDSATTFHIIRVRAAIASDPTVTMPVTPAAPKPNATARPQRRRPASPASAEVKPSADDLGALSDEFNNAATLRNWRRVFRDEQSGADQLQQLDIGRTERGWMTMTPHASTWYQDYRGELVYKTIEGDFTATTSLRATNRAGAAAPRSTFSLAGIMVRTPREVTPQTWRPGGENYIFLSLGAAREAGRFSFEVKTTTNSESELEISPAPGPAALIQVARIGADLILLRKEPERPWVVHRRYRRPDMPQRLQVGFTVYTDYDTSSRLPAPQHNTQVIRGGNPDLKAAFDYMRFQRPQTPAELAGRNLLDPQAVSDDQLLQFLGSSADEGPLRDAP